MESGSPIALAGEQDDPRRPVGRQRVGPAGLLACLADRVGAGELEGQQRHDPFARDPLALVGGIRAQEDQGTATGPLVRRCGDVHPERDVRRPREVAGHRGGGIGPVRRHVEGEAIAVRSFDGDATTQCRADGGCEGIQAVSAQGQPSELALEVFGLPVQDGPLVDQEPDHAPFERHRVRAVDPSGP